MKLSHSYGLNDLAALRKALLGLLSTDAPLHIETEALTQASLPLVQVLIAAHLAAQAAGKRLEITCPPGGALAQALERMGFGSAPDTHLRIENGRWVALGAA